MSTPQVIGPLSFDLARPLVSGDEWISLEPAQLPHESTPLRRGQFISAGGELRIILDVEERRVRVAPVDLDHDVAEYVWRPRQLRLGDGWYRLAE
jgi:hypothetical protein